MSTTQPKQLMGAKDIAAEYGLPLRTAENIFWSIAKRHGGAIRFEGVRRVFVRREWVEASVGQES